MTATTQKSEIDQERAESALSGHLLPLTGDWGVWRLVALRSAGFPAREALHLASEELSAAAVCVLEAEAELERIRIRAREQVERALDDLWQRGQGRDGAQRNPLLKANKALKKGRAPKPLPSGLLEAEAETYREAEKTLESARRGFHEAFERALEHQSNELHRVARDPRFREALLWQNRAAHQTAALRIASTPLEKIRRNSQYRQHEELVASYLQRYALKNDTIGFFGPIYWTHFREDGPTLEARPGRELIAERKVFFEAWAIEALAKPFARQKLVKPWLRPRVMPLVELDGRQMRILTGKPLTLSRDHAALLGACDGEKPARWIAEELSADPALDFATTKEVYAALRELEKRGVVDWDFQFPLTPEALDVFAEEISQIGHPKLRTVGQRAIDQMVAHRDAVAGSSGDPDALDRALGELEETFQRLTGSDATRNFGKVHGGRTLVYHDTVRDLDLHLGPGILEGLAGPLGSILDGVRWFSHELSTVTHELMYEIYTDLCRREGSSTIDGATFSNAVDEIAITDDPEYLRPLHRRSAEQWHDFLGVEEGSSRHELSHADLVARIGDAFRCPGAGWAGALQHNPDVLIDAESVEAVNAGNFRLIVGELHLAQNTLNSTAIVPMCPYGDELLRNFERDWKGPGLKLLVSRTAPRVTTRTVNAFFHPKDLVVPTADDPICLPAAPRLPPSALLVEEKNGRLWVRSRDGRHRFGAVEAYGGNLARRATTSFSLLPPGRHWPRITVGNVVIHRESWSIPAGDLGFAHARTEADRFLGARRWAHGLEVPRFVFVKTPTERKPFFVDFDTPVYVELLCRHLRRTDEERGPETQIKLSEMLPTPDRLWLEDAQGRRYTSEMRLMVVDRRSMASPS